MLVLMDKNTAEEVFITKVKTYAPMLCGNVPDRMFRDYNNTPLNIVKFCTTYKLCPKFVMY